jgi:hypothetical protein
VQALGQFPESILWSLTNQSNQLCEWEVADGKKVEVKNDSGHDGGDSGARRTLYVWRASDLLDPLPLGTVRHAIWHPLAFGDGTDRGGEFGSRRTDLG